MYSSRRSIVEAIVLFALTISVKSGTIEFETFVPPVGPWGRQPIILKEDGGYTNLLVAIHRDVNKTATIIEEIKEVFTYTSQLLYATTRQSFFFKSISILVPDTWPEDGVYEKPLPNETFHTARIILRNDQSEGAPPTYPFVRHPRSGVEGEYAYIPVKLLTRRSETTLSEAADICQSLWGQLRWGIDPNWSVSETIPNGDRLNFREFEDFQPPTEPHLRKTTPSFRLLRPKDIFSVVILDARENMKENNKFQLMIERYKYYLKYVFPTYMWLGVVTVSETTRQVHPCTKLWEKYSFRENMASGLPFEASGTHSLGNAVKEAIRVLNLLNKNISDSTIFIMSDGTDVESPTIDDVIPEVVSTGVILATLPFSPNATENIVLNNTVDYNFKGNVEFGGLTSLENKDKFIRIYQSNLIHFNASGWETFLIESDNIQDSQTNLIRVRCDDVNMLFCNYSTNANDIIIFEDSRTDDNKSADFSTYNTDETGQHMLIVESSISQSVSLEVFSGFFRPGDNSFGINETTRVRVILESPFINYTKVEASFPLFAVVTKNENDVTGVTIVGVVTTPDGISTEFEFTDDGLGAKPGFFRRDVLSYMKQCRGIDEEINDGIYSHNYDQFTVEGVYNLEVDAYGSDSNMLIKIQLNRESISVWSQSELPSFMRVPDSQTFSVVGIPPSAISNLTVGKISGRSVILHWTAPGEDQMTGRATCYDLRYGRKVTEVTTNFLNSLPVRDDYVLSGNLSAPGAAHTLETVNITFDKVDGAIFFLAVVAMDDHGNRGKVSNAVEIRLPEDYIDNNGHTTTSSLDISTEVQHAVDKTGVVKTFTRKMTTMGGITVTKSIAEEIVDVLKTNSFLAGAVVGVLVTAISCLGLCIVLRKKPSRKTSQSSQPQNVTGDVELHDYNFSNSAL